MLNFLKTLKTNKKFEEINNLDKAVMISSLMIECAKSDDCFSDKEKEVILDILKKKLYLDENECEECFKTALDSSNKSVEVYSLTKDIRDNFSKDEIIIIFQYLWQIILSDGVIDDFEASVMSKLTGLFHLTGKESAEAKKAAQESL